MAKLDKRREHPLKKGESLSKVCRAFDLEWRRAWDDTKNSALAPLSREERATRARVALDGHYGGKQRAFLEFVLGHYIDDGIDELDPEKLPDLLSLRYHDSISDAVADLGEDIDETFSDFRQHLYTHGAA
ncbi:MAG: type I restriction-modification enzyme R subunit C-terminal domain-containing protein [Lacipirellulaceae bacterium]